VVLPPEVNNQSQVQLRVITTDAPGSDEWIGVDDVTISGTGADVAGALRIATYNIASSSGAPRDGLGTILDAIGREPVHGQTRPIDVLALQEVKSQTTTTQYVVDLLNDIYGAGTYVHGSLDGATTGSGTQGIVYNTQTVELLEEVTIGIASTTGQPRQ